MADIVVLSERHAEQYRSLMLEAYERDADAFTSTPAERAAEPRSWWVNRIGGPDGDRVAFGAFSGDELVGTVALEFSRRPKTRHRVLVLGMFVVPEKRGDGVGRALLEAAAKHARARDGVRTLLLTVTDGNDPAVALYESLGFERVGTEPMAIRTPDGFKAKVYMWRDLAGGETEPGRSEPLG